MTARIDAQELKRLIPITTVVGWTEPLKMPRNPERDEWVGANHDSLKVNPLKNAFFWMSRGVYGDVFSWYVDVLGRTFVEAVRDLAEFAYGAGAAAHKLAPYVAPAPKPAPQPINPTLVERLHDNMLSSERAIAWCRKRGLDEMDISRFQLGYIENMADVGEATVLPVFEDGKLLTIRYRAWKPRDDSAKYMPMFSGYNAHLINGDELVAGTGNVIIVEGEFKTYHLIKRGYPVVGIMGASTMKAEWLPRFAKRKNVYIALDPDQKPTTLGWVKRLAETHKGVKIVTLPEKPDDLMVMDGGQACFDACVSQARAFIHKGEK